MKYNYSLVKYLSWSNVPLGEFTGLIAPHRPVGGGAAVTSFENEECGFVRSK